MNLRFASARAFLGVLLLSLTVVASAGTSAPKPRLAAASTLTPPAKTLADLATDADFHAERFKPLMKVAAGDWYCLKMAYWCDQGNQSACDNFDKYCTGGE